MIKQANHDGAFENWAAPAIVFRSDEGRRFRAVLLTVTLLAATAAACAPIDPSGQRNAGTVAYLGALPQGNLGRTALSVRQPADTGNMAYPDPLPQGNASTVTLLGRQPRDTGSMAYPDALPQGNLGNTALSGRQPADTGNMAYPAPSLAGNVSTTVVR